MFELCYFSTNEFVPAGWQAVDEDKNFPRLSSRNPQLHQADELDDDHDMTSRRAASESSNEDSSFHQPNYSSTTRMNDESSDEDELAPAPVSRVSPIPAFYGSQPKQHFPSNVSIPHALVAVQLWTGF
jgi:ubiquitin carboxyl-terminal hydrolase 4/11/15